MFAAFWGSVQCHDGPGDGSTEQNLPVVTTILDTELGHQALHRFTKWAVQDHAERSILVVLKQQHDGLEKLLVVKVRRSDQHLPFEGHSFGKEAHRTTPLQRNLQTPTTVI
jgi:hypothetical protein